MPGLWAFGGMKRVHPVCGEQVYTSYCKPYSRKNRSSASMVIDPTSDSVLAVVFTSRMDSGNVKGQKRNQSKQSYFLYLAPATITTSTTNSRPNASSTATIERDYLDNSVATFKRLYTEAPYSLSYPHIIVTLKNIHTSTEATIHRSLPHGAPCE